MTDLQWRQGTVYQAKNGARRLLIHHNPMQLRSLQLRAADAEAPFDLAGVEIIAVDELIELRRSGDWRDLGDLPSETVDALLETVIAGNALPPADLEAARALLRERKG